MKGQAIKNHVINTACREKYDPNFKLFDIVDKNGDKIKEYEGFQFLYLEKGIDKIPIYYENGMICNDT